MAIIDFKATKCRHCYKCVRNCEVKAIMVKDGRAEIMPENCILCGRCLQICPQSAKTLVSDLSLVKGMVEAGEKVVISIAPSYMGLLKYHTIGQVRCALMRLGFTDVRETAEGAALVTAEYAEASFGRNQGKYHQHLLPRGDERSDRKILSEADSVSGSGGFAHDRPRTHDQTADGSGYQGRFPGPLYRKKTGGAGSAPC